MLRSVKKNTRGSASFLARETFQEILRSRREINLKQHTGPANRDIRKHAPAPSRRTLSTAEGTSTAVANPVERDRFAGVHRPHQEVNSHPRTGPSRGSITSNYTAPSSREDQQNNLHRGPLSRRSTARSIATHTAPSSRGRSTTRSTATYATYMAPSSREIQSPIYSRARIPISEGRYIARPTTHIWPRRRERSTAQLTSTNTAPSSFNVHSLIYSYSNGPVVERDPQPDLQARTANCRRISSQASHRILARGNSATHRIGLQHQGV